MKQILIAIALAIAGFLVAAFGAIDAARAKGHVALCTEIDVMHPRCGMGTLRARHVAYTRAIRRAASELRSEIVSHPSGCPSRLFCGCGAAVRVFGMPIRSLWLAAAWLKFPLAAPAPGMVAVRRHHVFVLERQINGDTWLAYDANSGGGATRLHARSIAGYVIVNPHGGA